VLIRSRTFDWKFMTMAECRVCFKSWYFNTSDSSDSRNMGTATIRSGLKKHSNKYFYLLSSTLLISINISTFWTGLKCTSVCLCVVSVCCSARALCVVSVCAHTHTHTILCTHTHNCTSMYKTICQLSRWIRLGLMVSSTKFLVKHFVCWAKLFWVPSSQM